LVNIRPVLFPDDRRRYLMVEYTGGLEVPQWMLSDGTLRLLALTLLAYLPDFHGLYLVEEPEIGLHPTAIETVMQSLSSVYDGQVLITSHSPLVLSLPRPDQLLCFQKTENGTTIIPGNEHPMLSQWKSGVNISDLFAAGVLG
jgi:predicted ATPase